MVKAIAYLPLFEITNTQRLISMRIECVYFGYQSIEQPHVGNIHRKGLRTHIQ